MFSFRERCTIRWFALNNDVHHKVQYMVVKFSSDKTQRGYALTSPFHKSTPPLVRLSDKTLRKWLPRLETLQNQELNIYLNLTMIIHLCVFFSLTEFKLNTAGPLSQPATQWVQPQLFLHMVTCIPYTMELEENQLFVDF